MTVHDETIAKIRQLPESLVQEVNDFVEFLLMKHNRELEEIVESDFANYLTNLENYEERLARGEIKW
jgi:proline dehydrogenase